MSTIVSTPNNRDRHSRNLRGLLDYARVSPVNRVDIRSKPPFRGAFLDVYYANGAVGYATFADHTVCRAWVLRRQWWNQAGRQINDKL